MQESHPSPTTAAEASSPEQPKSGLLGGSLIALGVMAVALCLPAHFEVNDDFGMVKVLTGYDGAPAERDADFVSRSLSEVLWRLYGAAPNVPWYGLLLSASMFLGLTVASSALVRRDWRVRLLLLPAFLTFAFYVTMRMSFASTTLYCIFGVLLYLLDWNRSEGRLPLHGVLLTAVMAVAALWRTNVFLASVIFTVPILLFTTRQRLVRLWPGAAVLVAFFALDFGWRAAEPASDLQKHFEKYSALRIQFHDTAAGLYSPRFVAAMKAAGWESHDYQQYRRWMLYDDKSFGLEPLDRFLSVNKGKASEFWLSQATSTLGRYAYRNKRYLILCALAVCALIVATSAVKSLRQRNIAWRSLGSVVFAAGPLVLFLMYRAPERILVPLTFYAMMVAAAVAGRVHELSWRSPIQKWYERSRCVSLTLLSLYALVSSTQIMMGLASSARVARQQLQLIDDALVRAKQKFGPDVLLVPLTAAYSDGGGLRHPLSRIPEWSPTQIVPSGWAAQSPRFYEFLKDRGMSNGRELLARSVHDQKIVYFGYGEPSYLERVAESWGEYLDKTVPNELDKGFQIAMVPVLQHRYGIETPEFSGAKLESGEGMVFLTTSQVPAPPPEVKAAVARSQGPKTYPKFKMQLEVLCAPLPWLNFHCGFSNVKMPAANRPSAPPQRMAVKPEPELE